MPQINPIMMRYPSQDVTHAPRKGILGLGQTLSTVGQLPGARYDLLALGLLAGYALLAWSQMLHNDLYLFGDHPGQYYRFWSVIEVSWPQRHALLDWSSYWYAGYPEFQFYFPGYVLLGLLLKGLTMGQISTVGLYQMVLALAFFLPAPGIYALLRAAGFDRWTGLAGGILGLHFRLLWGGVTGLIIGMIGERMALGLVPLTAAIFIWGLESRRLTLGTLGTGASLAALILTHPFHAPASLMIIGLYGLWRRPLAGQALTMLLRATLLGLGLTAFWWLPLLVHRAYIIPSQRTTLAQTLSWFWVQSMPGFLLLSLPALATLRRPQGDRARALVPSVAILAVLMLAVIWINQAVLANRWQLYLVDSARLMSDVHLSALLLAAVGIGFLLRLPASLHRRLNRPWARAAVTAASILLILAGTADALWRFPLKVTLPGSPDAPRREFLSQYDLQPLWHALGQEEGRVLFTSAFMQWPRQEPRFPTSLKSLTPIFTGREILGGTFSHWTPVARYLWYGTDQVKLLQGVVQENDDRSFAGYRWLEMPVPFFANLARTLNATTVVATWDDFNARTFLDASPDFQAYWADDNFVLYRTLGYTSTWAEPTLASVTVSRYDSHAIDIEVVEARPGADLLVKIMQYPLWRARVDGQDLPMHADEIGLLHVTLPAGNNYRVELRYEPGLFERAGQGLSLFALLATAAISAAAARRLTGCRLEG